MLLCSSSVMHHCAISSSRPLNHKKANFEELMFAEQSVETLNIVPMLIIYSSFTFVEDDSQLILVLTCVHYHLEFGFRGHAVHPRLG